MLFGDEVLSPDRIDELDALGEAEATERELTMAQQLIDSLSSDFDPEKYHDEYRERVLELIERKAAGEELTPQPQAEEPAPAPDLMAALEASLAAVKSGDHDAVATPAPKPRKRAAAAKSTDGTDGTDGTTEAKAKRPAKAKR